MYRNSPYSSRLPHSEITLRDALASHNYIAAVQLIENGVSLVGLESAQLQRLLCASCWMDSLTAVMRLLSCAGLLVNQAIIFTAKESALPQNKSSGWVGLTDYVRSMPRYLPIDDRGKVHPHHWISSDYNEMNALAFAALFAQADVVQALVNAEADVSYGNYGSLTFCAEANKPDVLAVLMAANPRVKEHALYAVIQAAAMGHLECLRVMLDAGAAPGNPRDKLNGKSPKSIDFDNRCSTSPLFQAIRANQLRAVQMLCEYGADPSDDYVLHWGSMSGGNAFDMLREAEFFDGHKRDIRIFLALYRARALNHEQLFIEAWTMSYLFVKAIQEKAPEAQRLLMTIKCGDSSTDEGIFDTDEIIEAAMDLNDLDALRLLSSRHSRFPFSEIMKRNITRQVFTAALSKQRYPFLPIICRAFVNYNDYLLEESGDYCKSLIPGVYRPLSRCGTIVAFFGCMTRPSGLLAELCQRGNWPSVAVLWLLGNRIIRDRIDRTLEINHKLIPHYPLLREALDSAATVSRQITTLQAVYPELNDMLAALSSGLSSTPEEREISSDGLRHRLSTAASAP